MQSKLGWSHQGKLSQNYEDVTDRQYLITSIFEYYFCLQHNKTMKEKNLRFIYVWMENLVDKTFKKSKRKNISKSSFIRIEHRKQKIK